jgi:NADP-dependent 3-hydroxy-3-methylglutaryl-CoA reductase
MKVIPELSVASLQTGPAKNRRTRFSDEDRKNRLDKLREATGLRLPTYATSSIDSRSVSGNIENFIGTISLPVGVVGPLNINYVGESFKPVYAPLATTEGALVSSVQRGAMAINLSGGVRSRVLSNRMSRAPQFEFNSLDSAMAFTEWFKDQKEKLQSLVKNRSQHAQLIEVTTHGIGRTVHVRFVFSTGNAAGQNMTTFCTAYLCQWILNEFQKLNSINQCLDYIIEGNLSSDKKVSFVSAYEGRGRTVIAETIIKKSVLRRVLKLSVEELLLRFARSKSARIFTGQIGFNINVANIVAGFFLATGQDVACIHESSIAELHMEAKGEDLYATVYLPCLIVGTVGGGTHLPNFRDNLDMLGCLQGVNSADRLAQTIGAFALALELSTVSAVAGGQFVDAHENGARKATVPSLKFSDLNEEFFKKSLHDQHISKVKEIKTENKQGYVTDIALQVSKKKTGIFAYQIESRNEANSLITKNAFLKLKAHEREVVLGSAKIIQALNPGLAEIVLQRREFLPFRNSHLREIEVLSHEKRVIPKISPRFLGSFIDQEKETYILIQELIDSGFTVSEVNDLSVWTDALKLQALKNISLLHREYLGKKEEAYEVSSHLIDYTSINKIEEQLELWDALFTLAYAQLKTHYPFLFKFYDESLQNFELLISELALLPHSLIHYDFNPRNFAFHPKSHEMVFFDYEFAAWGLPQRDLIEFLLFSANSENIVVDFEKWGLVQYELMGPMEISELAWQNSLQKVTREFVVRRLPFYFILSEFSFCTYIDRLLENLDALVKHWTKGHDQTL